MIINDGGQKENVFGLICYELKAQITHIKPTVYPLKCGYTVGLMWVDCG